MFGESLQDYEHLRPPEMERFDYRHVAHMINYAGKDYMTAYKVKTQRGPVRPALQIGSEPP